MQNAEIGNSHRQITIGNQVLAKQDAVARTVHGFNTENGLVSFIFLDNEHVALIFVPMTRFLPEFGVVNVRGDDFFVPAVAVLFTHDREQLVINNSAMGMEERGACRDLIELEKTLVHSDLAVVAFSDFLLNTDVFFEFFVIGERNTIDTLQRVIIFLTEPVSTGGLGDHHGFDLTSGLHVGACAEIDQVAATVSHGLAAFGDLGLDKLNFERVLLEHF